MYSSTFLYNTAVPDENDSYNPFGNQDDAEALVEIKPGRKLGKVQCGEYGGGNQTVVDDLVYWYDIPSDAEYINPFQKMHMDEKEEKFMLFEKDGAGWNNNR